MKKSWSARLLFALSLALALASPEASFSADIVRPGKDKKDAYDITGRNISSTFKKFMKCNAGRRFEKSCASDFAAPYFHFDYEAVEKLRNYHVIMIPGGDYDFFSELVTQCEGKTSEDLEAFYTRYPVLGAEINSSIEKEVCPDYLGNTETYYDKYMDAYIAYEEFLGSNDIAFTRLQFSKKNSPAYIGDRASKVSLLADTIDAIEAELGDNVTGYKKDYILIGHSFGGLNISDFLVELLSGHAPGTPEDLLFDNSSLRAWPAEKKERIFKKIKAVAFVNTFVQGLRSADGLLRGLAKEQGLTDRDPVEFYIQRVLNNYEKEEFDTDNLTRDKIYHLTLRSNRYRGNYYLPDKNYASPAGDTPIKNAFDRIAEEIAVISVGCWVPRILPDFFVQPNIIVAFSKNLWRKEGIYNDGMVDTYSTIFPRDTAEYLLLPNLDHGALVLKPQVRGITIGHNYDQMPFIKTLFKRISTKMPEMEEGGI